jgi:hypothetical protein
MSVYGDDDNSIQFSSIKFFIIYVPSQNNNNNNNNNNHSNSLFIYMLTQQPKGQL